MAAFTKVHVTRSDADRFTTDGADPSEQVADCSAQPNASPSVIEYVPGSASNVREVPSGYSSPSSSSAKLEGPKPPAVINPKSRPWSGCASFATVIRAAPDLAVSNV